MPDQDNESEEFEIDLSDIDSETAFISYSRSDAELVSRIGRALESKGKKTWIDQTGISGSEPWLEAILEAIDRSQAFLFFLSPASLGSEICMLKELAQAHGANKKIIPVVIQPFDHQTDIPEAHRSAFDSLSRLNYIDLTNEEKFEEGLEAIVEAIHTDFDHRRLHADYYRLARSWRDDQASLLRGQALRDAEKWLAEIGDREPPAHGLQIEFIQKSREVDRRFWRVMVAVLIVAFAAVSGLAIWAKLSEKEAQTQRGIAEIALKEEALARKEEARARNRADSRQLASQAQLQAQRGPEFLPRAVLLAIESTRLEPSAAATEILRQGVSTLARPRFRLPHGGGIFSLQFSPGGMRVCTLANDGVRIWNVRSGQETFWLPAWVEETVLSEGGKKVAVAGVNGWGVWDGQTGECLHAGEFPVAARHVAIRGDGSVVACISLDEKLRIFETESGRMILESKPERRAVKLAFAGENLLIARRGEVKILDPTTGKLIGHRRFRGRIASLVISSDGRWAAAASGLEVLVINLSNFELIGKVPVSSAFSHHVHDLAFDEDAGMLAVGTDLETRIVSVPGCEVVRVLPTPADKLALDSDRGLVGVSHEGRLAVWNLNSGKQLSVNSWLARLDAEIKRDAPAAPVRYRMGWVTDLAFGPDSSYLLALSEHYAAIRWPFGPNAGAPNVSTTIRTAAFDPSRRFFTGIMHSGWSPSKLIASEWPAPENNASEDRERYGFRHHLEFRFRQRIVDFTQDKIEIEEWVPRGSAPPPSGNAGIPISKRKIPASLWSPDLRSGIQSLSKWEIPATIGDELKPTGDQKEDARYQLTRQGEDWWVRDKEADRLTLQLGAADEVDAIRIIDDQRAIVTDFSPSVRVWDLNENREAARAVHDSIARRAMVAPGGDRFATGTVEGDVWIWEMPPPAALATLNLYEDSYQFHPWRLEDVTGGTKDADIETTLKVLDGQIEIVGRMIRELRFSWNTDSLAAFTFVDGGYDLESNGISIRDARLRPSLLWKTSGWQGAKSENRWEGPSGRSWCDDLGIGFRFGTKRHLDYPRPSAEFERYAEAPIERPVFSTDDERLLITRRSTALRKSEGRSLLHLIDTRTGQLLSEIEIPELGSEWEAAVRSADGELRHALIGGDDGGILDLQTGEKIQDFPVDSGSFAPDGSFVVVEKPGRTEIIELPSMEKTLEIPASLSSAICPASRWIALFQSVGSSREKGRLIFLDRLNHENRWELSLERKIETVVFHPTEAYAAVSEGTFGEWTHHDIEVGKVRVYDLTKRTETIQFDVPGAVTALAFDRRGEKLASGSFYGVVRVWNWRPGSWAERAASHLTRNLSPEEWQTFFPEKAYRKTVDTLP